VRYANGRAQPDGVRRLRTMRTPEQGFTAKLTIEQREAVGLAMADTNMSARQISKAAKLGQLADFKTGELLEPFEVSPSYTADLGSALRRRRQGKTSRVGDMEHRDAVEALRRRFLETADAVLEWEEKRQPNRRDLERVRQCIRCVREAASLPGPKDPRPDPPGKGPHTDRTGEAITRGGMAGMILAEHRRAPRNADGPADGGPVETAE
jgi:hypothetical protein